MSDPMSSDAGNPQAGPAEAPLDGARAEELEFKTESLIKNHVLGACAASLVPAPLFDIAAITAVQIRMIYKLALLYDKTFSESAVRNIIAALGGGVVGHGGGVIVAVSLAKLIPGFGAPGHHRDAIIVGKN